MTKRAAVFGANGQVGFAACLALCKAGFEVFAVTRSGECAAVDAGHCIALDLADTDKAGILVENKKFDLIVNAAAFTNVDCAEVQKLDAMALNAELLKSLAAACKKTGAFLIHYSSDYVFDGSKQGSYTEGDETHPVNFYGESKLAGDNAVLGSGVRATILRTSWVYSQRGRNFVRTIANLAGKMNELSVVCDQRGVPTSAGFLADVTVRIAALALEGVKVPVVVNAVPSGNASWNELARLVVHKLGGNKCLIRSCTSTEWQETHPASATRPMNSVLDNSLLGAFLGREIPSWQECFAREFGIAWSGEEIL